MLGFTSGSLRGWLLGVSNLETTVGGSGFPLSLLFVNAYFRASWGQADPLARTRLSPATE
jgi:hypothetical protein